ncbi:hypothetical protein MHYP_G00090050 [Metynnis hypsauchen]
MDKLNLDSVLCSLFSPRWGCECERGGGRRVPDLGSHASTHRVCPAGVRRAFTDSYSISLFLYSDSGFVEEYVQNDESLIQSTLKPSSTKGFRTVFLHLEPIRLSLMSRITVCPPEWGWHSHAHHSAAGTVHGAFSCTSESLFPLYTETRLHARTHS